MGRIRMRRLGPEIKAGAFKNRSINVGSNFMDNTRRTAIIQAEMGNGLTLVMCAL
ncbi:MAG: hypothetical protein WA749_02815 [Gelidibacter sp.]